MNMRVGADIGGTFTDIVFLGGDGTVHVSKVPSTPHDYAQAILAEIGNYLSSGKADDIDLTELAHGTTVATNAILEGHGARVGLLTTAGFRDVLEIRRVRLPVLYDLQWEKPAPLVRRSLRLEIDERMGPGGEVRKPVDMAQVRKAVEELKEKGAEAVAVCLLHSYANEAHERAVAKIAREAFDYMSLSSEVLPEMREYERTATTVVDAYVKPVVHRYLERLDRGLNELGKSAPVYVMQSNGGKISDRLAADQPVRIIESGPAAGVIAAATAGEHIGLKNLITFDMGGTTAKASIIEEGNITLSSEYEVGSGINQGSRLIKGAGHLIRIPAIDVAEVGAGGGSIARIDIGGALKVGPESAGAEPGPACYGLGGSQPTVTDANVVLGFLNPEYLVSGALPLDQTQAELTITRDIADPLGYDVIEAAAGIHRVANAAMMRAIRAVSIERGRDPRDFTLMAFGGNGPVHAAGLARELGISRIVVPPWPGLFSAIGLLVSDVEQLYSRSLLSGLSKIRIEEAERVLSDLEERAQREFAAEGFSGKRLRLARFADVRYRRQISEIMLPLPHRALNADDLPALAEAFHREHFNTYGYDSRDEEVELVALKLRAQGIKVGNAANVDWRSAPAKKYSGDKRKAHFGSQLGTALVPVIGRGNIGTEPIKGPLIVEEYDSTTVVPPDFSIHQPTAGFLILERKK